MDELVSHARPKAVASIQIDNEHVVATEWRFPPGGETGWHRHDYDYVVVPRCTGDLAMESVAGDSVAHLVAGESYFRNAGVEHNVININEAEFVFVEIELKKAI